MTQTASAPRARVLLLDHTAQEGGAELALLRLAEAAVARGGFELRALTFSPGPLVERLRSVGVHTVVLPLDERVATARRDRLGAGGLRTAVGALTYLPRLARAIRGSGADLVVANSLKSAVFAAIASPLAGRRWVWHLHDRLAADYLSPRLVTAMRALALLGPRTIVVNSGATLATLPAAARRRSVIAFPGLPEGAFAHDPEPADPPLVGIIGRVSPTKGQREFLDAAGAISLSHPDVRFDVVGGALFGEDAYERGLREHADALGLTGRVGFTGWVSDAPAYLRRMTVLVHASPVPEPFGQVVAEAMAAGVPVIATAAGGVSEILDPAGAPLREPFRATRTGMLVQPGDPLALAAALAAVLDDLGAARVRAGAARADARERLTIARTLDSVTRAWDRAGARGDGRLG